MSQGESEEKRQTERFKSSIPVLVKTIDHLKVSECTLTDISSKGFSVRIENGKNKIKVEEHFLLLIDPLLFDISEENTITVNAICKRIDFLSNTLGCHFLKNSESTEKHINLVVEYFKRINENLY